MALGILVLITALTISGVAIYYSIAGLVAIFAAAALPIMIMGGALEIGKLVTAVWLHRHWQRATWWLKTYLTTAVIVLMFITSMGIFGFLSKAHIEQTSASEESVAQVQQIDSEIGRLTAVIERAEKKIQDLESSGTGADANLQAQIDKEQERIDKAFERIQPAINQQNKIIEDARAGDANRTKPYEDQLASIQAEILRLETSAREYEEKIANLSADTSAVDPLLEQIDAIEKEIIRVTNQVNSGERDQIRAGQAIIGVTSDGAFGSNTRKALVAWVAAQRERITQIQGDISRLRQNATTTVDAERERLAGVVKDIRQTQIPALKDRELTMLGKIDDVRATESPVIATARDEIQRLRKSAEEQVANSQALIERLRSQLAQSDKVEEIDAAVDEQLSRIKTAESEIDELTEEKYALQAEYRKLEAEVGPIKYIAEFVYGENADNNMLEEAVRWVILIIIFVFDPLAVLLLIAAQYTFEFNRRKDDGGERLRREYEQLRAQKIANNPGYTVDTPAPPEEEKVDEEIDISKTEDVESLGQGQEEESPGVEVGDNTDHPQGEVDATTDNPTADDVSGSVVSEADTPVADAVDTELEQPEVQTNELTVEEQKAREELYEQLDITDEWKDAKSRWKADNPNETLKEHKLHYIKGIIDKLPWEDYVQKRTYIKKDDTGQHTVKSDTYQQNAEQSDESIWKRIRNDESN